MKSVKSLNQFKSVIQTMYDIIKAHSGELKVMTKVADPGSVGKREGTTFVIYIPNN